MVNRLVNLQVWRTPNSARSTLMSWYESSLLVVQGPALKQSFKGSFAAPPTSPPLPISSSLINPPRLIGFWVGNFSGVYKGNSFHKWKTSCVQQVWWWTSIKSHYMKSFMAERHLAEIDADISADWKVDIYSPDNRHMLGWMQISI